MRVTARRHRRGHATFRGLCFFQYGRLGEGWSANPAHRPTSLRATTAESRSGRGDGRSWNGCWPTRTLSSTATRTSREARPSFAARGCRFSRSSTIWKAESLSTSSSISSRRCRRNRRSLRWIWRAILFWPVRVLLDENLPRALAADSGRAGPAPASWRRGPAASPPRCPRRPVQAGFRSDPVQYARFHPVRHQQVDDPAASADAATSRWEHQSRSVPCRSSRRHRSSRRRGRHSRCAASECRMLARRVGWPTHRAARPSPRALQSTPWIDATASRHPQQAGRACVSVCHVFRTSSLSRLHALAARDRRRSPPYLYLYLYLYLYHSKGKKSMRAGSHPSSAPCNSPKRI